MQRNEEGVHSPSNCSILLTDSTELSDIYSVFFGCVQGKGTALKKTPKIAENVKKIYMNYIFCVIFYYKTNPDFT